MSSRRRVLSLGVLVGVLVAGCSSPSGTNEPPPDAIWAGTLVPDLDHVRNPEPSLEPGYAYLLAQSKLAEFDRIHGEIAVLTAMLEAAASSEAVRAQGAWRRSFDVSHAQGRARGYVLQRVYVTGQEVAVWVGEPDPVALASGFMSPFSRELRFAYDPSVATLTWGQTRVEPQRDYWSLVLPWGHLSWRKDGSHRSVRFEPYNTPTRPEWAQEFQFFWDPFIGGGGVNTPHGVLCWNAQLEDRSC